MRIGNWYFEFYNARRHRPVIYGIDHLSLHGDEAVRPFALADVMAILMMISDRLSNAEWHARVEYQIIQAFSDFLHDNSLDILRHFFYDGVVRVDMSNPYKPHLTDYIEDWKKRDEDRVVEMYDEIYLSMGKTRAEVLRPHIDLLNTVNDSDLNLIRNYGALGVLSPENSTHTDGYLDDEQVAEMQKAYHKTHGVTFGKWSLLITRQPVKFQKIDLPIKDLELTEKRKVALASILQFLNVPKELHAMFESAKYANRNEAELDMYSNCVTSWANKFVQLMEKCYTEARLHDEHHIGYVADNDMWFDFVGVAALQEAQWKEKQQAREAIAMWQEFKAARPEMADYCNERIDDLIESL